MKALSVKIRELAEYIDLVKQGKLPRNNQIVHNLQNIFNLLPNLKVDEIVKAFSIKTNDQMHMTYVCSIIRSIVALHNLINNKIYNIEKTMEDE